LDFSTVFVCSS